MRRAGKHKLHNKEEISEIEKSCLTWAAVFVFVFQNLFSLLTHAWEHP
jgi:hypothetical protein